VDAEIARARAEVVAPHLQRPALRHAELDDHRGLAAKAREVPVIDVEVVLPLVDETAGVLVEIPLEVVHVEKGHIKTMSYCSGDAIASVCSEIGLPMKSDSPARCWLSSSSSISTTEALQTTRNSFGLNWRASRRISRRMSWQTLRAVFTSPPPWHVGHGSPHRWAQAPPERCLL